MTFRSVPLQPGVDKDNSPLQAGTEGRWIDADKIRFVAGLPETIYGQEGVSLTSLLGICRGGMTYADNARNPIAAFGTHLREYAMDLDGNVTDITPATTYSQPSISFTTTLGSAVVTTTSWTHGLVVDQKFKLENSTVAAVGGVTINGTYVVLTVESATSITYTAAQTATSGAGPTAATVDVTAYLAPGQADGLGGLGFGVGAFGLGGYASASSGITFYPRTWSFAPWGQNLLASPRGGGLYEWAPNVTASELVTNGDFTSSVGWSSGSGWAISGGVATATAGVGSDLSTNITCAIGAWHLLTFTLTRSAGTLLPKHATSSIGSALSLGALYRLPFFSSGGGTESITFTKDSSFVGTLDNVSAKVLTTAQIVPNAPTQIGSMFTTAERSVVACGSNLDGTYDALQVDWSDQENNQQWTALTSNYAGGYTLPAGGRVVRGLAGVSENLLWTDESLWSMRYNANPNSVYDFIEMGKGCGLVGPNAAAQVGSTWYWMTPAGAFYAYNGSTPVMVPCSLSRDLKDNLAWVQQDKVYASRLVGKNYAEVWWFIPDSRDGIECSRYVIYDTLGGTWSCGTFNRTTFLDATNFQYPMAVDTAGKIWFHEKGFTSDGAARSWSIKSSVATTEGGQLILNGVKPDADDLQGGYTITPYAKNRDTRGIFSRTYPAMSINAMSGKKSCRVQGEQVGFTIAGNAAPTFWRHGMTMYDLINSVRKR